MVVDGAIYIKIHIYIHAGNIYNKEIVATQIKLTLLVIKALNKMPRGVLIIIDEKHI